MAGRIEGRYLLSHIIVQGMELMLITLDNSSQINVPMFANEHIKFWVDLQSEIEKELNVVVISMTPMPNSRIASDSLRGTTTMHIVHKPHSLSEFELLSKEEQVEALRRIHNLPSRPNQDVSRVCGKK